MANANCALRTSLVVLSVLGMTGCAASAVEPSASDLGASGESGGASQGPGGAFVGSGGVRAGTGGAGQGPGGVGQGTGGASAGAGGSIALGSGGSAPDAATAPACVDVPPHEFTCEQEKGWGKCGADFMTGFCLKTCGNCIGSDAGTPPVVGASDAGVDCGLAPADKQATARAKKLLCYLKTHTYISGQTDWADGDKVAGFSNGKFPAMIAFDFMSYTTAQATVGNTSQTQPAIDFFNGTGEATQHKGSKGIVQFQWHWIAPTNGGNYNTNWDWSGINDTSSQAYKNIVADIDIVGSEMVKMQNAGIVTLFRPLHESNNNYMWWAKKGPDLYKALWKVVFDRITGHWNVHNLLWVFNGMAEQNGDMGAFYPGDDYADIVGSDYFQSAGDLNALSKIGTNKVLSIPETFAALDPAKDAPWNYWDVWASRDWNGSVQGTIQTAMANPKTITITDLPDMTKW
jgi:hypothetical protein